MLKPMRFLFSGLLVASLGIAPPMVWADSGEEKLIEILTAMPAYEDPKSTSNAALELFEGMHLKVIESAIKEGDIWFKFKAGKKDYWLKSAERGKNKIGVITEPSKTIVDSYGILNLPHRYAVKLVKFPGATGQLETYKREG